MEKALVLVGMSNREEAYRFFMDIIRGLSDDKIPIRILSNAHLRFETPHADVRFIYDTDDGHMFQQLDLSLRAEVVFGHPDNCVHLYPYLRNKANRQPTMAIRAWIVEYETSCEARDRYVHQDVAVTAEMAKMWRTYANSVFGLPSAKRTIPEIKRVHFSGPATCVIWTDGTKTLVRCSENDTVDYEKGLAMAIAKKVLGTNKTGSNYYDVFKQWLPKPEEDEEAADE